MAVFDSPSPPDSRLGGEAPLLPHVLSGSVVGVGGKAGFSAIRYPALMAYPLSVS